MPARSFSIAEVFARACPLSPAQRARLLERSCPGAHRHEVESLLAAFDQLGDFIEKPAVGQEPGCGPRPEVAADRFGDYVVHRPLGTGGCGSVYLARRPSDQDGWAALKVIKAEAETPEAGRWFEAERAILARLHHPGIARLIDAGTSDSGRPYLLLEYVAGGRITRHCAAHRLRLRPRLQLFLSVCDAIQYAHTHGVIHGDLKPANILVSTNGRQLSAKVIDFGVARTFGPDGELSAPGGTAFAGTPAYASPEQLAGSTVPLSPASDTYALGLILYELLCGCQPFPFLFPRPSRAVCAPKRIHRSDPPRPSERLRYCRPVELRSIMWERQTRPAQLYAELNRGLDAIVLRCLQPAPADRYPSVAALAAALRQYLPSKAHAAG